MDSQNCAPISPSPATSPSEPPMTPLTRRSTTSSAGSGRPIPAGHWILNLSGNCPRCHHHHRTVKIHVRASTASNRISDVDCSNCRALWLASGTRNSTRISLLSVNTIPAADLTGETEFRSTLVQMVRSATAIAAPSVLSGIPETTATGPSHTTSSRLPSQVRRSHPGDSRLVDAHAWVNTTSRPSTRSFSARISKAAPIVHLGRRIDGTFPNLKTSRLGRLMKLDTYTTTPPERSTQAYVGSSSVQASASRGSTMQNIEDDTRSENTTKGHRNNPSPEVSDPNLDHIPTTSVEERDAWLRAQITAFKDQLARRSPIATSATVDRSTQLTWADALLLPSSIQDPHHNPDLIGIGSHFGSPFPWDLNRGSTASVNRTSLSISETQLSQTNTAVDGELPPYILESFHRRSGGLRPASLYSTTVQHLRQPVMNPRSSLDLVAAASIRSAASPARERASARHSWQAVRGSSSSLTEELASQSGWQARSSGEVVGVETSQQPSPSPSLRREHRMSA
jgi:hypothetical protein